MSLIGMGHVGPRAISTGHHLHVVRHKPVRDELPLLGANADGGYRPAEEIAKPSRLFARSNRLDRLIRAPWSAMSPPPHPVLARIREADRLIIAEAFDALMDHYTDDAVLVMSPGREVLGREAIREAMEKIATYFAHGLKVTQQGMHVLEAGETVLVLARTLVSAPGRDDELRHATYVYRREADGQWRCCIDNSYGHRLLDEG